MTFKRVLQLASLSLAFFAASAEPASAEPLDDAWKAASQGPEVKKLKVYDHEFNVKPYSRTVDGKKVIINGQISHHLSRRPDDQVYYTIVLKDGAVVDVQRRVDEGGLAPLAAPILAAAGIYFTGTPIPPDQVETVLRAVGKAQDGSWLGAADTIIANIALRAK
jgi:hypothetical protein